jgi:hypothetical protein
MVKSLTASDWVRLFSGAPATLLQPLLRGSQAPDGHAGPALKRLDSRRFRVSRDGGGVASRALDWWPAHTLRRVQPAQSDMKTARTQRHENSPHTATHKDTKQRVRHKTRCVQPARNDMHGSRRSDSLGRIQRCAHRVQRAHSVPGPGPSWQPRRFRAESTEIRNHQSRKFPRNQARIRVLQVLRPHRIRPDDSKFKPLMIQMLRFIPSRERVMKAEARSIHPVRRETMPWTARPVYSPRGFLQAT